MASSQDKPDRKPNSSKTAAINPSVDQGSGRFSLNTTLEYIGDLADYAKVYNRRRTEQNRRYLEAKRKKIFDSYRFRGVEFIGTPENFDKLKNAGADDEFFSLLKDLAPKLSEDKIRPLTPPKGSINLICAPKECLVTRESDTPVSTQNGELLLKDLDPGAVSLKFTKQHYADQMQSVKVVRNIQLTVKVELEYIPTSKELLDSVWTALGAGERGANLQEISASGSASLFDVAGKETFWGFTAKLSDKSLSTFDFKLLDKPAFKIQCDNPCKFLKTSGGFPGRGKPPIDQAEAIWLLSKFRPVHLGSMIRQLTAEDVRVISSGLLPSGNRKFVLEGPAQNFELELGPSQLPARVFVKETHGSDVYEVIYSDYVKISESSQYPRRTEFRMKTNQRGVKIEFTGPVSKLN